MEHKQLTYNQFCTTARDLGVASREFSMYADCLNRFSLLLAKQATKFQERYQAARKTDMLREAEKNRTTTRKPYTRVVVGEMTTERRERAFRLLVEAGLSAEKQEVYRKKFFKEETK
jgi:hypothetical protein